MRLFKIPYDVKREEKIFGGYLSLRQVIYLMLAASSLSILATGLPIMIKLILIIMLSSFFLLCTFLLIGIVILFFLLCAFFRINEQNFDKFFFFTIKYLFRKKQFIYRRDF